MKVYVIEEGGDDYYGPSLSKLPVASSPEIAERLIRDDIVLEYSRGGVPPNEGQVRYWRRLYHVSERELDCGKSDTLQG